MSEKPKEKINVGADHNGLPLKNVLRDYLPKLGVSVDQDEKFYVDPKMESAD